jgi:hypothetical protein
MRIEPAVRARQSGQESKSLTPSGVFFLDIKRRISYTNFHQGASLAIDDEFLKQKGLPKETYFRL